MTVSGAPRTDHVPQPLPDSVNARKLHKRLKRQTGQAISDFGIIDEGDRVMVAMSGGKDSHTLLDLLLELQGRARSTSS